MAKGREIKLPLPAADDLFSTQEERDEVQTATFNGHQGHIIRPDRDIPGH